MATIGITGVASPLGRSVARRVAALAEVDRVIGVDLAAPAFPPPELELRVADVRDRLLARALDGCDALVHCGGPAPASDSDDERYSVAVQGLRNVLAAADKAGAGVVVVVSTAAVYGAHPDNPLPLDEDAPLRANRDVPDAHHAELAERELAEWAAAHPSVRVVVLRPALLAGPELRTPGLTALLAPRLPVVRGCAPAWQLAHVDDVAAAVALALTGPLQGAYNVASDGWLAAREVCTVLGRRPLDIPETTAYETLLLAARARDAVRRAARRLGLRRRAQGASPAFPPAALAFVAHPWVVDTARLHAEGWAPSRSNREILRELAAEHAGEVVLGPLVVRRSALYAAAAGAGAVSATLVAGAVRRWRRAR